MTTVIPRYFEQEGQLKELDSDRVFGVEFRFNTDVPRYNLIATSHVLVFVLKGVKTIHRTDGDIVAGTGSFVFIPRGSYVFSDVRSEDDEFKRLVLFFEDAFLKEFLNSLDTEILHKAGNSATMSDDIISFSISPLLERAIETLEPYLNEKLSFGESLMKMKILEILLTILESDNENRFLSVLKRVTSSPKRDLRHFMEQSFIQPLTVAEFAKLSCRSSRQFTRDFRELFNESPREWIRNKRLEYAHHLIHTTDQSVTDICFEAGFSNYSNFIQLFRQRYNITPKQLLMQN